MRLDTGNRSFFGLLGVAFVAYQLLALGACLLLSLLAFRLATAGLGEDAADGGQLAATAMFLGLVGLGGLLGLRSLLVQARASLRLASRVRTFALPCPTALRTAAARAGLEGRVSLIDTAGAFSFAYGAFHPRVAVSRSLFESASPRELDAVLEHERYHVRNLDPLKVVLARALARGLFFLPALRELEGRYLAARELAADRRALATCGRRPLASALLKAVKGPGWPELAGAAAIGGPELLDARVAQLESHGEPPVRGVSRRALITSVAGLALLTASFAAALGGLGGITAAMRLGEPGMEAGGVAIAMALGCAAPWLVAGWLAWRWISA